MIVPTSNLTIEENTDGKVVGNYYMIDDERVGTVVDVLPDGRVAVSWRERTRESRIAKSWNKGKRRKRKSTKSTARASVKRVLPTIRVKPPMRHTNRS